MPKSKRRKTRYIPRTSPAQRPAAALSAQPAAGAAPPVRSYSPPIRASGKAAAIKSPPIEEMSTRVSADLKVISLLTGAMVVAIVVLAFVLH